MLFFFFFKQKTAYEIKECDWSSDVCSSDLKEKRAVIVDRDACMECGACSSNCPVDAINVKSGVGCATGIIIGALQGTEPTCDCGSESGKGCC